MTLSSAAATAPAAASVRSEKVVAFVPVSGPVGINSVQSLYDYTAAGVGSAGNGEPRTEHQQAVAVAAAGKRRPASHGQPFVNCKQCI